MTDTQVRMLAAIANGPIDDFEAITVSRSWRRTIAALDKAGLIDVRSARGMHRHPLYFITPAGKEQIKSWLASGRLVQE